MDQLRAMLAVLSPGTRKRLVLAIVGSALVGLAEVVGLLTILPLMQLLTGQSVDQGATKVMSDIFGTRDTDKLAIISAALVFVSFLTKGLLTVAFRWWMLGFLYREEAETSLMLLRYYVRAPYQLHLQRNSADLIRTMNDAVGTVFSFVIVGGIGALGEAATIFFVLATLLALMPLPTLGVSLYFGLTGFFFARAMRRRALRYGTAMIDGSLAIYQGAMQTLGGVKEIKIRHKADYFLDVYRKARWDYATARRAAAFINDLPKYFMEILFIVGIALTAVVIFTSNASDQALTMLTLFVAAGFRVLPSTVRLLGATNGIRVGVRSLELIVTDMQAASALDLEMSAEERAAKPLAVRREVAIRDLTFRYQSSPEDVVRGIDLDLPAGTSTALVGVSGAGKSTLVDLVLGLHTPRTGSISVDGHDIRDQMVSWQRSIGLVPQDVYLLDDTLRANIAFGEAPDEVDVERLQQAVHRAQLRRAGGAHLRRSAAADRHRPRALRPAVGADPRRGHLGPRQRDRAPGHRDHRLAARQPHDHRGGPPTLHRARLRPGGLPRPRHGRGGGLLRGRTTGERDVRAPGPAGSARARRPGAGEQQPVRLHVVHAVPHTSSSCGIAEAG
jgi:ABC-type multidrug transport system fused ATPase/permease subunit